MGICLTETASGGCFPTLAGWSCAASRHGHFAQGQMAAKRSAKRKQDEVTLELFVHASLISYGDISLSPSLSLSLSLSPQSLSLLNLLSKEEMLRAEGNALAAHATDLDLFVLCQPQVENPVDFSLRASQSLPPLPSQPLQSSSSLIYIFKKYLPSCMTTLT